MVITLFWESSEIKSPKHFLFIGENTNDNTQYTIFVSGKDLLQIFLLIVTLR